MLLTQNPRYETDVGQHNDRMEICGCSIAKSLGAATMKKVKE